MKFPVVFDKSAREFSHLGVAVLENASEVKIYQVINGQYTLSLVLPRNDEKWEFIKEENIICVEGQAFRIRSFEEQRSNVGKLTANISCEHISYDLNDIKHLPDMNNVINVSPYDVFHGSFMNADTGKEYEGILNGTPFTLSCEVAGTTDLFLSKTSPREVLNRFVGDLSCEILYDNFHITLVERLGNENAVQFRVGKNLSTIKRTTDSTSVVTRLYPYGKDYLDITSVNDKVAYIDSPLIDDYDYVHEGYLDYTDIDDPEELMQKAKEEWSTTEKDGIDKPKVTYSVTVEELKKISEYATFEAFSIGDTVTIYDSALGIDVKARILEYTYYPYEPQRSSVVLSNFKENIGEILSELIKAKNTVERITTSNGNIDVSYIESVKNKLAMKFGTSLAKSTVIHDYANVWVDDADNPTSAIALVDGMFALASSKNDDGTWNWRTVGSGGMLVADSVHSDWVYAGEINASQIKSGIIYTDEIQISSRNGEMLISGTSIEMTATKDSEKFMLNIDANDGVEHIHTFDDQGRPLKKTVFDYDGVSSVYYKYSGTSTTPSGTYTAPYLNLVYTTTAGGKSSDDDIISFDFTDPPYWYVTEPPCVMVFPAEPLQFVQSNGGRVGDLSEYECNVHAIQELDKGYRVSIKSKKKYVKSISTSGNPNFAYGSMAFNLVVIFR